MSGQIIYQFEGYLLKTKNMYIGTLVLMKNSGQPNRVNTEYTKYLVF